MSPPSKKQKTTVSQHREASSFSEGSIRRITLRDFLTYDFVEVYPGPNLNLIIGPNGTGKSTVVCAICLGLAGKPEITGRAAQPQDYIKHGCKKAYIEIELHTPSNGSKQNYVIGREINEKSSVWTLNGKNVNKKDIETVVSKLKIQVTNLCQFLPQDRVAEFCKMTKEQLLVNTQHAIGSIQMYSDYCTLKELCEKAKGLEISLNSLQEQMESEKQKNSQLESEVRNYQSRQQLLEKIKTLKMKRHWVEYDLVRQEHLEVRKQRDEKVAALQQAMRANAPLKAKLQKISGKLDEILKTMRELAGEAKSISERISSKTQQIEKCNDTITELYEDLKAKKQDEEQRELDLQSLKQQLLCLEQEIASLANEPDVAPLLEEVVAKLQANAQSFAKNQRHRQIANSKLQSVTKEKSITEDQVRKLQDTSRQKLELLRKVHTHAYDGAIWLQNNRDKFSKPVYEPIMTQVNVKDQRFAKYVESTISFNDMVAFVCEDPHDMELLMSSLHDNQGLNINAVLAPRTNLQNYKSPRTIEEIRKWGFHSYLKDLITAPDAVLKYLCEMYRFHMIPVGNDYTKTKVEEIFRVTTFRKFYTQNHVYTGKQSRYGNKNFSTLCHELREPRLLIHSTDLNALNEKQGLLQELDNQLQMLNKSLSELKEEEVRLMAVQEQLRTKKKNLTIKRDQKATLLAKLGQKEERIKQLQREACDIKKEERDCDHKVLQECKKKHKLHSEYFALVENGATKLMEKARFSLMYSHFTKCKLQAEGELREANSSLQSLQQEIQQIKEKLSSLKAEARNLCDKAKKLSNVQGNDMPDELKQSFASLPATLQEIDDMIHQEEAKADCLLQTDESVIHRYKQRKKDIHNMEKSQGQKQLELTELKIQIEVIKERWLPSLEELISKVNQKFGFYFSQLKCAGEVSLYKGENPNDFDKYGICIKVKYRSTEPLQELTSFRQSGGERSVATVLYMMALQELTFVPFRCVDEINQGMDAENERRVFDLIVKTACKENSAQYFLLTPKLLDNLPFSPNMKILLIHNGERMIHCKKWSISHFLELRRKV